MYSYVKRVWDSPTFTTWASRFSQLSRLLLVLPLLLDRFNEVEIACWFMFSMLLSFSALIAMQCGLVMARMIATANGGSEDLSPIQPGERRQSSGLPNWGMVGRVYATMGSLDGIAALLTLVITLILGAFSLAPLLDDYADADEIWLAFSVFVLTQFFSELFRRYSVALRGLNKVALSNRWATLFVLLSSGSGACALLLGANIVELAVVMQAFVLLGVIRQWLLLRSVSRGCFNIRLWRVSWDREVIGWMWSPFWKGLIQVFSNKGAVRMGVVFLARHMSPEQLASFLLSLRLLEAVGEISMVPFTSNVPYLSKLLGSGNLVAYRSIVLKKFRFISAIQVLGVSLVGFGLPYGLSLLESSTRSLEVRSYFILALAFLLQAQIRQLLSISAVGNNIIAVGRYVAATSATLILSPLLISWDPFWGFILAVYCPAILIVNFSTLTAGCNLLEMPVATFARKVFAMPWVLFFVALLLSRI